jgi:hypothetical protein
MHDPISVLRAAGFPVDQLSDSQREVIASLSEHETDVVASVHARLRETESDVVAHDLKLL